MQALGGAARWIKSGLPFGIAGIQGAATHYFLLEKITFASSRLSFDPMSNQIPGTRHV
jgi:hypothetical protein